MNTDTSRRVGRLRSVRIAFDFEEQPCSGCTQMYLQVGQIVTEDRLTNNKYCNAACAARHLSTPKEATR